MKTASKEITAMSLVKAALEKAHQHQDEYHIFTFLNDANAIKKAAEIDDNVQRLLAQAMEAAAAENLRARAEEDDERDMSDTAEFTPGLSPEEEDEEDYPDPEDEDDPPAGSTSRIDFGSLQFGRDYEIT